MQAIYACCQMHLCLLSNASMLAIKCIYACYQMHLCLLSNVLLIAVKCIFIQKADCISRNTGCAICFLSVHFIEPLFKVGSIENSL